MKILTTVAEAHAYACASSDRRVLVPTMGALHRGHLELVKLARAAAGASGEVIVSIFVNPLQFEPGSDFSKYPRPQEGDEQLCRDAGVDLLYRPNESEMYAPDRSIFVEETALSETLCGRSRPGHFRGVCTVVTKLFHALAPHVAVFGEKDFQQLSIIRRLVRDLDFDIEIIGAPIVREKDGLACSSRNQYLNRDERTQATSLRAACLEAQELAQRGERSAARLIAAAQQRIEEAPLARVDYVELVEVNNLQPIDSLGGNGLLAVAVFFGKTRLIDNIRLP